MHKHNNTSQRLNHSTNPAFHFIFNDDDATVSFLRYKRAAVLIINLTAIYILMYVRITTSRDLTRLHGIPTTTKATIDLLLNIHHHLNKQHYYDDRNVLSVFQIGYVNFTFYVWVCAECITSNILYAYCTHTSLSSALCLCL